MSQLSNAAHQTDIPVLTTNYLLSVKVFADNGYTIIFHPHGQGTMVHAPTSFDLTIHGQPLLTGYHDGNGLWWVPLVANENAEDNKMLNKDTCVHKSAIHNVY